MDSSPYSQCYIDISGKCNARCYFCERGARRRGFLPPLTSTDRVDFISPAKFEEILYHILENKIISHNAHLSLYNWGEPMIHPQFEEILGIIKNCKQFTGQLALSTNASRNISFRRDFMPDLPTTVVFTIPGFSQQSYDRAHGFNFQKTMDNISSMATSLQNINITALTLTYLGFKYNIGELKAAQNFAQKHRLHFAPTFAYFNSVTLTLKHIKQEFSDTERNLVEHSLILDLMDQLGPLRPSDYKCPQFKYLALSPEGQVNLGCCVRLDAPEDYYLGDICQMSLEEVQAVRQHRPICKECRELGLDFFGHNAPKYAQELLLSMLNETKE